MFKALLVEVDEKMIGQLAVSLMNEFGADVVNVSCAADAKKLMDGGKDFDLFIVKVEIGDEKSATEVLNYLYDHGRERAVYVLGKLDGVSKNAQCFEDNFRVEELIREVVKTFNITKEQISEVKLPDYVPIPIKSFYSLKTTCCDIYIKLKRKDEDQFIKRILSGDMFDQEAIKRYENSGVNELYIKKDFRGAFYNLLLSQTATNLKSASVEKINPEDINSKLMAVTEQSYNVGQDLLIQVGINEQTVKLAQMAIKAMITSVSRNKKLGPLLKELLSRPGSFAFKHSQLISILAAAVLPKLELGRGNQFEASLEKMVFVSFFHDLLLKEDRLASLQNKIQLYEARLSDSEKDLVVNHANRMATMTQGLSHVPTGADIIIRQHHGVSNGVGFADGPVASISPHAIVFVVLESFANMLLNFNPNQQKISDLVDSLYQTYSIPSYRKIVDAIKKTLGKN